MSNNSVQAKDLIHRARTRLLSSHPFYGYMACRLKLRELPDEMKATLPPGAEPTLATDGEHLFYDPDFVVSLTKTQLVASIAHETEHVYLKHPIRGISLTNGEEELWPIMVIAGDLAINPHLKDAGFDLFPESLFPEQKYWTDSLEQHYKRLKKAAKKHQKQGCGGACSGVQKPKGGDGKIPSAAELARMESELQTTIMNAASFARAAGKLPADIERMIESLRAPKIAWFDVLRRFMQATTKNDYRMLPPNRRYIYQNMYLPSLRSEAVADVLLLIDGSGSTCHVFPQFISEFASILLDVRPERLHVMVWDTRCTFLREFDGYSSETKESLATMQGEMGAGGGTVFTECFNYFEEEVGTRPNIAIVLTDMELFGDWPADPGYPIMWVASTDIIGPYGETVKIEVE